MYVTGNRRRRSLEEFAEFFIYKRTRLAFTSILGPFGVHLLKFTLDTHPGSLMHSSLGLLEFLVRSLKHHNTHETYLIYRPMSMIAILSLDFLLLSCLLVRLWNALLNITKYMSSTGIIRNFGRLRAVLWKVSRLNFTRERDSSLVPIKWPYHLQAEAIVPILYFKQIFFLPLPDSFSLVLKHRNSVHLEILIYNRTHTLEVNVDQVNSLPVIGDFLFWLAIFFGLVFSLKLQMCSSRKYPYPPTEGNYKKTPDFP